MTVNAVNTYIVPSAANEVTMPSQPAFLGTLIGPDNNVTGNGTLYTIGAAVAFTQIFDQNADFNTNGTFTAPVTGRYLLIFKCRIFSAAANISSYIQIVTSNRTYQNHRMTTAAVQEHGLQVDVLADMDATDTAIYKVYAIGQGADTDDIANIYVSGALIE